MLSSRIFFDQTGRYSPSSAAHRRRSRT